jgi:similar to stage IV sporulation protein
MERQGIKKSEAVQQKTNTSMKIIRKGGLPFFLCRYKKRKLFLFGIFLCFLLLFGLSQFVWEIEVEGNISYTKEDIVKYMEREWVPLGTFKWKVDCATLEEQIRLNYDQVAWVSCSLDGCRLLVHIKETLDKNSKNNAQDPCDLIATKSGVITSIVTRNGTPLVEKGSKVKKGDTLITGNVYIFSDSNEVLETHQVIADGDILAKTRASYESSFSLTYYKKEYKSKKSYTYAVYLCQKRIPLMPGIKQSDGMDQIVEKYPWKIGKTFYLPISMERTVTRRYTPIKKQYSEEEARSLAKKKIQKKIHELEKMGIKVLSQKIEITIENNQCKASGYFILEEPIGKIRSIQKLSEEQEKQITPTEEISW